MGGGRPILKGWRYVAFIGSIVGAISLAVYPIIVMPYLNPEPWQKQSKEVTMLPCLLCLSSSVLRIRIRIDFSK